MVYVFLWALIGVLSGIWGIRCEDDFKRNGIKLFLLVRILLLSMFMGPIMTVIVFFAFHEIPNPTLFKPKATNGQRSDS